MPQPSTTAKTAAMIQNQGNQILLADMLDRLLDKGVVVRGHLILTVAEVELLYIDLSLLVSSVDTALRVGRLWRSGNESGKLN